jgi:hypothetical protein
MYVSDFEDRPCKINPLHLKELRFEGAYYQIDKNNKLDVYFFYNNCIQRSIAIDSNHYNSSSIAQSIQKIIDDFNVAGKKNDQYFEDGGYSVTNNQITIQSIRYIPQFAWGIVTYKGSILNDSTILFTEFRFPKRNIFRDDSIYYHFIKTNKPDSLEGNRWKDKKWYWR